ncbi:unnamed protein product [Mytilus coruscus]|uniref:Gustatory receptor n=1 Tax=Mytilus coruscus TaxID=42192 RepID=A0A6J8AUT1_MYTCO|nr:unnamed protein product [Mytilus coruscus]
MSSLTKRKTLSKHSSAKIAWTNEDIRSTDDISITMYWYIITMSWLGFFHPFKILKDGHKEIPLTKTKSSQCRKTVMHFGFCFSLALLLGIHSIRTIVGIFVGDLLDETRNFKLVYSTWVTLCFVTSASILYVSYKPEGICVFFDQWNKSREFAFTQLGIVTKTRTIKLKVKAYLIIALILLAVNVAATGILMFAGLGSASDSFIFVFSAPFKPTTTVKVFVYLSNCISGIPWLFPVIFFVLICSILKDDMETYNIFFNKQTKDSNGKIGKDLTRLRLVHLELCKTISSLDSSFSWLLFTWFVLNIANGCFIAFLLLNSSYDTFGTTVLVSWLITSFVYICATCISAAILHEKLTAHAPLEYLYDIDINDVKPEDQPQLYLFLSKLTSSSVGLTAFGLVTITKELLLTLAGLYLTYFFLLLQFR